MWAVSHHEDVIVNGLGNPNNTAQDIVLLTLGLDGSSACIAAIAAHHKQHVNAPHVYPLHYLSANKSALLFCDPCMQSYKGLQYCRLPSLTQHRRPLQQGAEHIFPETTSKLLLLFPLQCQLHALGFMHILTSACVYLHALCFAACMHTDASGCQTEAAGWCAVHALT